MALINACSADDKEKGGRGLQHESTFPLRGKCPQVFRCGRYPSWRGSWRYLTLYWAHCSFQERGVLRWNQTHWDEIGLDADLPTCRGHTERMKVRGLAR